MKRSRSNLARRGFTLLEVALVALLGAMFTLAAIGVFTAMDRGDRRLARRYDQAVGLNRLQNTLRRVFGSLVVSEEATPPSIGGSKPTPTNEPTGDTKDNVNSNKTYPAPRFILDEDPALGRMTSVAKALAGGSGSSVQNPQRIEVVLAASPVADPAAAWERFAILAHPSEFESRHDDSASTSRNSGGRTGGNTPGNTNPSPTPGADAESQDVSASAAVRGALELRPKRTGRPDESDRTTWEIWWTKLAPRDRLHEIGEGLLPAQYAGEPVLLATDVTYFHVRVFQGRKWHDLYSATWFQQLPAYFQVEVETANGLWARWLFEVGWMQGPEVFDESASGENNDTPLPEADSPASRRNAERGATPATPATKSPTKSPTGTAKPIRPSTGGSRGGTSGGAAGGVK